MAIITLYNKFSSERKSVSNAFYLWKSINNGASTNKIYYNSLTHNSNLWNIVLYSLQITYFIGLRRMFDKGDTFSVDQLLCLCIKNIEEFNKENIGTRKTSPNDRRPEWLDKYLVNVYEAKPKDFLLLRGELKRKERLFSKLKLAINKAVAHKEMEFLETPDILFTGIKISYIEEILEFLFQLDMVLFDLLHNGRFSSLGSFEFKEEQLVYRDVDELFKKLSKSDINEL